MIAATAPATTADSESFLALDHLLSHPLVGVPVADHVRLARDGEGRSIRLLAMLGLRYCDTEHALAVSCQLPADDAFLWTRWHEAHQAPLLAIAGAKLTKVRIGGLPRNCIIVPLAGTRADTS